MSKSNAPSGESGQTEVAEKPEGDASDKAKEGSAEEESLEERLRAMEARAEENYDRVLRITAEFENYKKRMERETNDFRKFANESLIKDILPIVDNLERALEIPYGNNEKALQAMREGVQMTLKGLLNSLEKFGVVPIESMDKPFDPNFHQAVMQKESEGHSENTVSEEFQKGYMMRDRLLRPAMVVVSKKADSKLGVKSHDPKDKHKIDVTIQ
ncbi:MAG: nucleotide exchange factor GrpE [Desulfobacterales bacterium]|nr:nucleotide exchange factor GrpE [Desulfobacterales bacterium]